MLFAPGGMNSIAQMWRESPKGALRRRIRRWRIGGLALDAAHSGRRTTGQPRPWIDPTTALADLFKVVAMDQRNAGASTAPIRSGDGWESYAEDHISLLDHLGLTQTHVMGGCIGSSYCLRLCHAAPERVTAAVLQNPIGLTAENRPRFIEMFDSWAAQLRATRPDVTDKALADFRGSMFGGDFVFSVDRDFVSNCPIPMLVLAGNDEFHPRAVAEEVADIAPTADLILEWAGPERHNSTRDRIREFLSAHTP
jgi:pimeloyl-ACP methyl ester carboxylesterase